MANKTPPGSPGRPRPSPIDTERASSSNSGIVAAHPKIVSFRQSFSTDKRSKDFSEPNEQSPLLEPRRSADAENGALKQPISPMGSPMGSEDSWSPQDEEESKSSWYMLLLTLGSVGLQIGWSVEMSNGSPYLLSLGLSKSWLALVWIAGPLSGVLVQPVVGMKSDRCRIRWGRRRPFIVGGCIATVTSIMILAWTREIVAGFLSIFGADAGGRTVAITVMLFAVLFIYILDFAINVIQAAIRAYIVDCTPTHQQDTANAWASRQQGVGNIIGMAFGGMNLPKVFPFLGQTQFKVLCALASVIMATTTGISVASVSERDPTLDGEITEEDSGIFGFFRSLWTSVLRLPTQIARVCEVQFLAWIGWFPFLFYTTTYIGEIYVEPIFEAAKEDGRAMTEDEISRTWELGTRRGTIALLIFAITTFISSIVLPFMIRPSFQAPPPIHKRPATPLTPTTPGSLSASGYFNVKAVPRPSTRLERLSSLIDTISQMMQIPGLTIRKAWLFSHILFAICMFCTFIVRSVVLATILVGIIGIPWATTMWAPFALISAEISKRDAIRRGLIRPPPTRDGNLLAANEDDSADQAGVVLGIHNVAVSAPQVVATLISSLIFKIAAKPRGDPGDESVAWCFRFGGVCALVAAYLTTRVGEENEGVRDTEGAPSNRRPGRVLYDRVGGADDDEE